MSSLDYIKYFCLDRDNLTKDSFVECPECCNYSPIEAWEDVSVECDVCGDHDGIICPICDEIVDYAFSPLLRHRL